MVFGLLFWITKSLPVISVAHGITNVSLFLVAPGYPEMLLYLIGIPCILFLIIANVAKHFSEKNRTKKEKMMPH
jgi:hypothetical protein